MKVLFITHYSAMLGANRSMLQLIIELKKWEVEPTVLLPTPKEDSDLKNELIKRGIPYIEAPIRWIKHANKWKVLPNYLYTILLYPKILTKLNNTQFDIIHSNSSVIGVGAYISRKMKANHVWHLREFGDLDYNLKTPFGKWFQRVIYRGNNNFIAISQKIKRQYIPYLNNQSINLIYNGIIIKDRMDKERGEPVKFCIVGLIHKNKGQLDVIKAVECLVTEFKITNIHVTIVGDGDINYVTEIKSYIDRKGLNSYIEFVGYLSDINDILSKMDVGIMASYNEAFGRTTVEYMMSGLTVIATDGGANCEIVENEKSGLLYRAKDFYHLALQMKKVILNPKLSNSLANEGFNRAKNEFSSLANSTKIYNLYTSILNKN